MGVKIGWDCCDYFEDEKLFLNGEGASYKIRRVGCVFDGVIDRRDPYVCVEVYPSSKSKLRGIQVGDVMGTLCSVIDEEKDLGMVDADVFAMGENMAEWTYENLEQSVKLRDDIPENVKKNVYELLYERRKALSRGDEDLGESRLPEFKIILTNDTPIYQRPRHFPLHVTQETEEQWEELERVGVLEESKSVWNSPIAPIQKPDGRLRLCIDYRKVNERLLRIAFRCVWFLNVFIVCMV